MKYIVHISRILVGVLFIISGFVKLVDPLGMSYKLQEYFSEDVLNVTFLEPYALAIAVFVVVFEVVLGVFLLIGYKPKFTVWSLFAMIIFFTFLTFYSAYFDKVKDCGCFGDALKLDPWETFAKDIALLVLVLILLFGIKYIKPIFSKFALTVIALLSFVASLSLAYYVLMHLPTIDFRPYKVGVNIQEGMSTPEDAAKPIIKYKWKFNVNGKEETFITDGSYPSVDGEYISVDTKIIDEGYMPPIQDFLIESDDEDLTEHFLNEENLIIIAMYDLNKAEIEGVEKLKTFSDNAIRKGYTVIGLTSSGGELKTQFKIDNDFNFDFYLCDDKAIKAMVRSNPGIVKIKKGTVVQKVHYNDIDDLELPKVERLEAVTEKESILYLIDDRVSTKADFDALKKEDIEETYFLYDNQRVLDSINKIYDENYTGFVKIVLKKE
jgi:uncharacterized membrane protein YphA (DoxX/SURF4 family)